MSTFLKLNSFHVRRLVGALAVAAIVVTALANGLEGLGVCARAAMRLPDEATSLEPWLIPSNSFPAVVDTMQMHETPPLDTTRRIAVGSPKVFADRQRRQIFSRTNKRALAEFMGLVTAPGAEHAYGLPFQSFQSCREFAAVNC
jgi:hypothetical protein